MEEFKALEASVPRIDEIVCHFDLSLALHPERGLKVPGTSLWALAAVDAEPPLMFFYRFTDTHVHLMSVRSIEELNRPRRNGDAALPG